MEGWFLALEILFAGLFFVLCAKRKYKTNTAGFFILTALSTSLLSSFQVLLPGTTVSENVRLFSKTLTFAIDPLSAFFAAIFAFFGIFYFTDLIINKRTFSPGLTLALITICVFSPGICDITHLITAFILLSILGIVLLRMNTSEKLFVKNMYYIMFFYIFLKLLEIAPGFPVYLYVPVLVIMVIISGLEVYKLCRESTHAGVFARSKNINILLSISSFLFGIFGDIYNIPIVSILSYSASFAFMINVLLTGLSAGCGSLNVNAGQEHIICDKKYLRLLNLSLLSLSGIPLTFGFTAYGFIFTALICGCVPQITGFKIISIVGLLVLLLIYTIQISKIFAILKKYIDIDGAPSQNSAPYINFAAAIIIILSGLLPVFIMRLIFVPVSFFTGGVALYDIFKNLEVILRYFSVYTAILLITLSIYFLLRWLVLKFISPKG